MCRGTVDDGSFLRPWRRLVVRAFYLRMSSSCSFTGQPPEELTLVYHPAIGGAALEVAGRALPPASPAKVTLLRVRGEDGAAAYASAEGARFEVFEGKELAADGVFVRRAKGGGGWRVECRRALSSRSRVAEVVLLAEGGVLVRAKARAAATARSIACLTRLEGIPEEEASWGPCECGTCGEEWEMVGDSDGSDSSDSGDEWKEQEEAAEMETMRWARGRCASASGCSPRPAASAGSGRSGDPPRGNCLLV